MTSLPKLTVKHIARVIRDAALHKRVKPPLGRWILKDKKDSIDLSIMYSNEDHCGVCSGYAKEIRNEKLNKEAHSENEKILNDEYIWILGHTADSNKN